MRPKQTILTKDASVTVKITPMMEQYLELREANPGFLLFYRMGDFYELFGEHAVEASAMLGITLTQRRSKAGEEGMPMCGVPFHAAESYIGKLLKNGRKVALCEQTETPDEAKKARGSKALVNREVVRLYTGGTLTEESMLKPEENNYLSAIHEIAGQMALAWLDLSTGEFKVTALTPNTLTAELSRLGAKELLITESLGERYVNALNNFADNLTIIGSSKLSAERAEERLKKIFDIKSLDAFNFASKAQIAVCGALLAYAEETQTGKLPTLMHPRVMRSGSYLYIDPASRSGLELTQTMHGERKGSLMDAIDNTVTPAGSRNLSRWLSAPLQNLTEITDRQHCIGSLLKKPSLSATLQDVLKKSTDMGRSLSRITLERGSPRDLAAIRTTIGLLPDIIDTLSHNLEANNLLETIKHNISGFENLHRLLDNALNDSDLPLLARDGGFVKSGFCPKFDEYKELSTNGMGMLKELERIEGEKTGITNLRVKYNKVWGYFIEVTKAQSDKIPTHYIHRQTTTNAQRFSTATLMELERKYSAAEANTLQREQEIFTELNASTRALAPELLRAADALAELDVLIAGALLAERNNYVCPQMDASRAFDIVGGRHPVVEQTVDTYVSNDTELSDGKLWLITGPNMAGKSTFLRQNALITILAHMGYYVPAKSAKIGLVDRIFTRIGAADDLSRGQSTFMLEMVETAAILNGSTEHSLVILDEIGRGTATYDGLSIAWAAVEHLVTVNRSRGLFATHYHEMTELEEQYPALSCHHVSVKEWEGDIIFLHQVKEGAAPGSYGIHVGKIAGLPKSVTKRAEQILHRLETTGHNNGGASSSASIMAEDGAGEALPLFGTHMDTQNEPEPSEVEERLFAIDLDEMTPRQAHDLLYDLKRLVK